MLEPIHEFLKGPTPAAWLEAASSNIQTLLIDHAYCELKAASTALSLMYRYPDKPELLQMMSPLAREELLHFEKVKSILDKRQLPFHHLSPSRYAKSLFAHCRKQEPHRLIDSLIIGAFIEARSCERFHALQSIVDKELSKFFNSLLRSESRHFLNYLELAQLYSKSAIDERIESFALMEWELISSPDSEFRFHSGIPYK